MLDIAKCYDCIDTDILLKKLENTGIRGTELLWFKSYLKGRNQKVEINDVSSKKTKRIRDRINTRIKFKLSTFHHIYK